MQFLVPDRSKALRPDHPEWFEGHVLMQVLWQEQPDVLAVFFERGARTRPHIHATNQILHIVSGHCLVATRADRKEVGVGETIMVPAGEWHWHGAAPGEDMCHLSIRVPGPTDWTVPNYDW